MEAVEDDGDKIAVSFITPCQPVDNTVGTAVESLERYIDIVIIKEDLELGMAATFSMEARRSKGSWKTCSCCASILEMSRTSLIRASR